MKKQERKETYEDDKTKRELRAIYDKDLSDDSDSDVAMIRGSR